MSYIFRIDLNSTKGYKNSFKINRIFREELLSPHLSESQWKTFCNKVDDGLEPLGTINKRLSRKKSFTVTIAFLISFGIFCQAVNSSEESAPTWMLSFMLLVGVQMVGMSILLGNFRTRAREDTFDAIDKLKEFLSDESSKMSNVDFEFRDLNAQGRESNYYIQCIVEVDAYSPTIQMEKLNTLVEAGVVTSIQLPGYYTQVKDDVNEQQDEMLRPATQKKTLLEASKSPPPDSIFMRSLPRQGTSRTQELEEDFTFDSLESAMFASCESESINSEIIATTTQRNEPVSGNETTIPKYIDLQTKGRQWLSLLSASSFFGSD